MKSEENQFPILDVLTVIILVLTILAGLYRLKVSNDMVFDFSLIIVSISSITTAIMYFIKIRQLQNSTLTPISDTIVTLGGFHLGASLFLKAISGMQFSVLTSFLFIGFGIIGRILLFDRLLLSYLSSLRFLLSSFRIWVGESWIRVIKVIALIIAICFVLLPSQSNFDRIIGINLSLTVFVVTEFIENIDPTLTKRGICFIIAFLLYWYQITIQDMIVKSSFYILIGSLLVWVISYPKIGKFLQWLVEIISSTPQWLYEQFRIGLTYISVHPVGSAQIFSIILAMISYVAIPQNLSISKYQTRMVVSLALLLLAGMPNLINIGRRSILFIWREIVNIGTWFYDLFTDLNTYLKHIYLKISGWIYIVIKSIRESINRNSLVSAFSYLLIILYFYLSLSLPIYLNRFRFVFLLSGIFLWNIAYPHRRERIIVFINWIKNSIYLSIMGFVSWFFKNVFLIGLTIIGFSFFIGAFGLVFPGSVGLVDIIFGSIMGNRLISLIIGIFLTFIGGYTIQQAQARKSDLQRNLGEKSL